MYLENLHLYSFKNYLEESLEFSPFINCFLGPNGSGKTSLLDAIYYLSLTKSALNPIDNQCIRHGDSQMILRGDFSKNDKRFQVICHVQNGQKKAVKLNKKLYTKLSEHIGKFPVVMIAPNDTEIIRDGSETRRKFFDGMMAQYDQPYLDILIKYQQALKQRNSLLKSFAEHNRVDKDQLEPWDSRILNWGALLFEARKEMINQFIPLFEYHYNQLSDKKEKMEIEYQSDWHEEKHTQLFKDNLKKDLLLKRTMLGSHRDDYDFLIDGHHVRKFGSQGQQKSFVIALKLAQFDVLKEKTGAKPILLLDDIFDKLDDLRIARVIQLAAEDKFGQIFITDARPERTLAIIDQLPKERSIFLVESGRIKTVNSPSIDG